MASPFEAIGVIAVAALCVIGLIAICLALANLLGVWDEDENDSA